MKVQFVGKSINFHEVEILADRVLLEKIKSSLGQAECTFKISDLMAGVQVNCTIFAIPNEAIVCIFFCFGLLFFLTVNVNMNVFYSECTNSSFLNAISSSQ